MFKRSYSTASDVFARSSSQSAPKRAKLGSKVSMRSKRTKRQKVNATMVKSIVKSLAEKKVVNLETTNHVLSYNSPSWSANCIIPISPYATYLQIDQGDSQDQRIGNVIRPYKSITNMFFSNNLYNATSNPTPYPFMVRVVAFSVKENNDLPTTLDDFFQTGSSSGPPISTGMDMLTEINKDKYTPYYDQVIKVGTSQWSTTGATPLQGNWANNDYSSNPGLSLDLTKYLPAKVTYNDGNSQPTSKAVFLTWFIARSDGRTPNTTDIPGTIFLTSQLKYTDT